jgi:DNA-binding MarR family transcriptional regulator
VATESADVALVAEWRDLLARHARTWCALERELGRRHQLGVSEFEVLERLAENPRQGSRVQDLAASVCLSQGALSRVIGRLEKQGLVERAICPDDRRGIHVALTAGGRARYAAARDTQRAVLAATLREPAPVS